MEDLLRRIRSGTTTQEDAWLVLSLRSRAERAEAERDKLRAGIEDLRRCHDEHYRDVVQLMAENERLREIIEGYWGAGYIDGNADG